jgi:hypothetical protein
MRYGINFGVFAITLLAADFSTALAQPPESRDGPPPGRRDHLREALDTNGDHELDADEIKNASASLAKADKDGDGKISHDEFRPPLPPIPRGPGGFRGPPPPSEGAEEARPPRSDRPGRDAAPRGEGRGAGGPSPERFVERAMTFDADGDGKLDKTELEKFAGEMADRMRSAVADRARMRDGEGPRRRPERSDDDDRPERPRRPE